MLPASRPSPAPPMISSSSTLWATASKEWVIPPKPKPGRKPKKDAAPPPIAETEEVLQVLQATDGKGRRVQNRAAQRAFRERKQSQLAELQARIQLYEQCEIERNVALQSVAKRLKEENEALRAENNLLKEKVAKLEYERSCSPREIETKRSRDDTPTSSDYAEPPASKKVKLALEPAPPSQHGPRSVSLILDSSPPSMVCSPDSQDSSDRSTFSPAQLESPASDEPGYPPQISLDGMFDFQSGSKQSGYDSVSSLGHFDCGFCNEHTPCVCREIALNEATRIPSEQVFKIEEAPPVISILDNLPAYQPPVPLRRRPTTSPVKTVFPVVKPSASSSSSTTVPANCSGDPSNCSACADDVFGKAFCTAIGESVESNAPCANCPSPSAAGPSGATRRCCGGGSSCAGGSCSAKSDAPHSDGPSSDIIPTNDAWRQLKSHPNVEFADLALLAEVVAGRSKCTGPRVIITPPSTPGPMADSAPAGDSTAVLLTDPHARYHENRQKHSLTSSPPPKLVPHEELVECGRRRGPVREVHADAVREALRLLDTKFGTSN